MPQFMFDAVKIILDSQTDHIFSDDIVLNNSIENQIITEDAYSQSFRPLKLQFWTITVGVGVGKHWVIMLSQFNWDFNCLLELSLAKFIYLDMMSQEVENILLVG